MGSDYVECLGFDLFIKILMCLDDPGDLVRASAVSRRWRRIVVENSFCKNLVLGLHPEASTFAQVIEIKGLSEGEVVSSEWDTLVKEHRAFALFSQHLKSPMAIMDCILQPIAASSTDNYPEEGIENTVEPSNALNMRPLYWSSKGAKDPKVPETLTYRLSSNLFIIHRINIRPFKAYFQYGHPIYSAQNVRFKMGHSISSQETKNGDLPSTSNQYSGDDYIWTYVSPTYSMVQANMLQSFKLPRPVICIGGVLQIEFLDRVQKQEMDELYYLCMCYVQVLGRPSPAALDVGRVANSDPLTLNYFLHARNLEPYQTCKEQAEAQELYDVDFGVTSGWHYLAGRRGLITAKGWNGVFLGTLLGDRNAESDDDSDVDSLF